MHGYHGTTQERASNILKNEKFDINYFEIKPDAIIPKGQRLANDLGNGVYIFFHDEKEDCYDALNNTKKYTNEFKNHKTQSIIKIVIRDLKTDNIIDFNIWENQQKFIKFREKLFSRLINNLKISNLKDDGSKKRNNIDGIFLEYMLRYAYKINIDMIIKDSFTSFYGEERYISNFPNGREACIRNVDIIDWKQTKAV